MQQPARVARVRVGLEVVAHESAVVALGKRNAPARADPVVEVDQRRVRLRRRPPLEDARDAEAAREFGPHVASHSRAHHHAHFVIAFAGYLGLVHEVATDLADVLEAGHAVTPCVVPEARRREAACQQHRRALRERTRDHHHSARAVVERQDAADHVVGSVARDGRHAVADAEPAHVREPRGLGQTRRSRGVDEEEVVTGDESLAHRAIGVRGGRARQQRVPVAGRRAARRRRVVLAGEVGGETMPRVGIEALDCAAALAPGDHQLRRRRRERVLERAPARVAVDQRDRHAEFRETHPGAEELRPVLHQQRRDVAATQAQREGRMRRAIRVRIGPAVGHDAIFVEHEGLLGMRHRALFEAVAHGVRLARRMAQRGGRKAIENRLRVFPRNRHGPTLATNA